MPGIARHTPTLTGSKAVRLVIADTALLPHLGELIAQLTRDTEWIEIGDSVADTLAASWEALESWYGGDMIGQISHFIEVAPPGWLALDGSTHAVADYDDLAAKLPASWLSGGNFTLPDMQDIFLAGTGAAGAPGTTGGVNTYALTVGQLPSHTHGYTMPVVAPDTIGAGPPVPASSTSAPSQTSATGSGETIDNRPEYLSVVVAIYAGKV